MRLNLEDIKVRLVQGESVMVDTVSLDSDMKILYNYAMTTSPEQRSPIINDYFKIHEGYKLSDFTKAFISSGLKGSLTLNLKIETIDKYTKISVE